MKSQTPRLARILAGTALALLMGASAEAAPVGKLSTAIQDARSGMDAVILAQGEQDVLRPRRERSRAVEEQPAAEGAQEEEAPRERRRKQRAEQQETAPKEAGEESPRQRRRREAQSVEESAPAEQQPRRERQRQAEQQPDAETPRQRSRREQRQQAEEQPTEQAAPEQADDTPRPRRNRQAQGEEQRPAEEAAPAKATEETPRPRRERQQQAEERPAGQQSAPAQAEDTPRPRRNRQAQEPPAEEAAPEPAPAQAEEVPRERPRRRGEQQTGESEAPRDAGRPVQEAKPETEAPRQRAGSDNQRNRSGEAGEDAAELPPGEAPSKGAEQREDQPGQEGERRPRREAESGPPPTDDRAAQRNVRRERVESVEAERGTRRRDDDQGSDEPRRRERPTGTDVLREIGDRLILRYNDQVIVESSDRPRLRRNAREVYTEDLPRGRTRETVVRADGSRVVTVRNSYGDIIRRSRFSPEGREIVLNYVEEEDTDRVRDWRDPGLDLPPFRPNVREEDYILDAERAPDQETYYEFLEKPPVEQVERLYSVDEVKRSARVRQKTRRVDLDTVTFDFGSAAIPESQISKLDGVAGAMERLLEKNPGETFLIEGHTDAVGSDEANLALSDRRAEAVAEALTNVFAIPPENLATQGYGEQFLKVQTSGPERENRRVAIRRITPLVAPVSASAN